MSHTRAPFSHWLLGWSLSPKLLSTSPQQVIQPQHNVPEPESLFPSSSRSRQKLWAVRCWMTLLLIASLNKKPCNRLELRPPGANNACSYSACPWGQKRLNSSSQTGAEPEIHVAILRTGPQPQLYLQLLQKRLPLLPLFMRIYLYLLSFFVFLF